jgi:CubicO group peptidase (beta-lactamase class C family)
MKKIVLTLFLFIVALQSFGQSDPSLKKIDSLMKYFMGGNKFMGSVTIMHKNNVIFDKAYGFSDVEKSVSAVPGTKYKIGSITNMFTSAVIFQLIEEKKLTSNTKLSEFYPQIKNADSITVGQLLNHKSGIRDYTTDTDFDKFKSQLQTKKKMLDRIASYDPAFKPDAKAEFSNSNYLLLSYIIEDITKQPYKGNVITRIIKKAGLKNTYYFSKINPQKKEAYSYTLNEGSWKKSVEWHESVMEGAGGFQSTSSDLTDFIKQLFDGKIISKESLAQMTEMDMGYGKGVFQFPFGERRFYGHNGTIEGFASVVGYYPKDDLAISITANGLDYDLNDIVLGILSSYYKLPYRFPNFATANIDEAVLKSYEGIYSTPSLPFKVEIIVKDGVLVAVQSPGDASFELNPLSETEFNYDPADLKMIFSKKGFTLVQGDTKTEFKKEK